MPQHSSKFTESQQKDKSSRLLVFKKDFRKILQNFKKKPWDLLIFSVNRTGFTNFSKKEMQHKCFSVKFKKLFRGALL